MVHANHLTLIDEHALPLPATAVGRTDLVMVPDPIYGSISPSVSQSLEASAVKSSSLQCPHSSAASTLLPESASGGAEEAPARAHPSQAPTPPVLLCSASLSCVGFARRTKFLPAHHSKPSRAKSQPGRPAKCEWNPKTKRKPAEAAKSPRHLPIPPPPRPSLSPISRRPPAIALLHCAGTASPTSPAQRWRRRVERARPVQRRRPT